MTTLKAWKIFKMFLDKNGTAVSGKPEELFRSENRYRDIAFSPDGLTLYVITDMKGPVQAMKEGPITPTTTLWSPGSLLVFKYWVGGENVQHACYHRLFQLFTHAMKNYIIKHTDSLSHIQFINGLGQNLFYFC